MKKYFKAATAVKWVGCALFLLVFNACKKNELSSLDSSVPPITVPLSQIKIDSVFQVQEVPSAEIERSRLQQRLLHSDFSETGFYIEPNGSVKIQVDLVEGKRTPKLIIGTLSRYISFGNASDGGLTYIQLKPGMNEIKDTKGKGGLMFLQFSNSFPVGVQKSSVRFVSGMLPAPYFKLGKTSNEQWRAMLSYFNNVPDVVIATRRAMMVVSLKNAFKFQKEDLNSLLTKLDGLYDAYDQFSGLDGGSELNKPNIHKVLMTEMDQAPNLDMNYMFATNKRTVYNQNHIDKLITANGLFNTGGYGVWHEIGHMYQMGAWTWKTVSEATVQLYAHVSLRKLGISKSEFNSQGKWAYITKFLSSSSKDFTKSMEGIDESTMNYWVRTGMFYQLWLKYGDTFYIKLHQYYRETRPAGTTDEVCMANFMHAASVVSGNDLTEFFHKWGFNLNASAFKKVQDLNLPAPNVDISTLRD